MCSVSIQFASAICWVFVCVIHWYCWYYKPITHHHAKLFTCNQLMEHHVLRLHQSADERLCYSLIPEDTGNHWTETASM